MGGLERADQDQACARRAFHQHVQHPVDAVIQVDVGGTGFVPLHEMARAWSVKSVTSLVVFRQVGFRLDDDARAPAPHQLHPDEFAGAEERVALKKRCADDARALQNYRGESAGGLFSGLVGLGRLGRLGGLVANRLNDVRIFRIAQAEGRNEFRFAKISLGRGGKAEQRWLFCEHA